MEPIWADAFNFVDFSVSSAVNLIYAFHFYSPHFFTAQGQAGRPPAQSVTYPGVTQDSHLSRQCTGTSPFLTKSYSPQ